LTAWGRRIPDGSSTTTGLSWRGKAENLTAAGPHSSPPPTPPIPRSTLGENVLMNATQVQRLRRSLAGFRPCGPAMIARVLGILADRSPGVRALFPQDTQGLNRRLFDTLSQIVAALPQFQRLEAPLMALGARAAAAGANAAHYRIARDALLATMAELAGKGWSEDLEGDWALVLDAASGAMLHGSLGRAQAA
jgi:hemoglobin-like flavoprotein